MGPESGQTDMDRTIIAVVVAVLALVGAVAPDWLRHRHPNVELPYRTVYQLEKRIVIAMRSRTVYLAF